MKLRQINSIVAHDCAVVAVLELHWLPDKLIPSLLDHYDVQTLIIKKQVLQSWRQNCTNVIHAKRTIHQVPARSLKPIENFMMPWNATASVVTVVLQLLPRRLPKCMVAPLDNGMYQTSRFLVHLLSQTNVQ
jgi:hypothetical protein